jgi:hypothetical protein
VLVKAAIRADAVAKRDVDVEVAQGERGGGVMEWWSDEEML